MPGPLHLSRCGTVLWIALVWWGGSCRGVALDVGDPAPGFKLPKWASNEPAGLEDFSGQIVVLDFFAYWCAPCRRGLAELEKGIQRYYAARNGNPHGLKVQVLSINIEPDHPDRTAAFIEQTKASLVVNDSSGDVFQQYGGASVPLLAVIDGSRATPGGASMKIAYLHSGYEGMAKLRRIIDAIGPGQTVSPPRAPSRVANPLQTQATPNPDTKAGQALAVHGDDSAGAANRHWTESGFEASGTSGITLTDSSAGYRLNGATWEVRLSLAHSTISLDYEPAPADIITSPAHLNEGRSSLQTSLRKRWPSTLTWLASGGGYDGFTDYRSRWLDEYYRQYYTGFPGYSLADPRGYNFSAGARWEYLPTAGFFQADALFSRDDVSPGYEIGPFDPLRRGTGRLYTSGVRFSFENVFARRGRALQEIQIADTTDRDPRFSAQSSLNWALGEHWVLRSSVAAALEVPRFKSISLGATLEYDRQESWFFSLVGRFYQDTGQIENAQTITSATPPLETFQTGLGLRWQGAQASLKVFAGPYFSRYSAVASGPAPFASLYRDRDWWLAQAAFAYEF